MLPFFPTVAFPLSFGLPGLVKSIAYLLVILNVRSLPLIWHCTWLLLTNVRFLLLQLFIIIFSEGSVAPHEVVVALATCPHTLVVLVSHEPKRRAKKLRQPYAHDRPESA